MNDDKFIISEKVVPYFLDMSSGRNKDFSYSWLFIA